MSHSRSDKCKKDCIVRCGADVEVELEHKPRVHCQEVCRKKTDFEVELEIEINPRCKLSHKKDIKDGCKHKCIFGVDIDFDCDAKALCRPCGKPSAQFRLDIEVPTKTKCDVKKHCGSDYKKKYDNSDYKKKSDDSDSKKKCDDSKSHKKSDRSSNKKKDCGKRRYWY